MTERPPSRGRIGLSSHRNPVPCQITIEPFLAAERIGTSIDGFGSPGREPGREPGPQRAQRRGGRGGGRGGEARCAASVGDGRRRLMLAGGVGCSGPGSAGTRGRWAAAPWVALLGGGRAQWAHRWGWRAPWGSSEGSRRSERPGSAGRRRKYASGEPRPCNEPSVAVVRVPDVCDGQDDS